MPFIKHIPPKKENICISAEHIPPTHIVLPPGEHTYVCPSCGKKTVLNVPLITMST